MINPNWTSKGKSVAQLIEELRTFENQEMEVRISVDDGDTSVPISLVSGQMANMPYLRIVKTSPLLFNTGQVRPNNSFKPTPLRGAA
jgi:hypothetical protein